MYALHDLMMRCVMCVLGTTISLAGFTVHPSNGVLTSSGPKRFLFLLLSL
jgi:hypothetical protein